MTVGSNYDEARSEKVKRVSISACHAKRHGTGSRGQ